MADTPAGSSDFTQDLLRWSEALSGIARTGLGFTQSLYERERFEEVLKVAADIRTAADEDLEVRREAGHFVQEWLDGVGEGVRGIRHAEGRGRRRGRQRAGPDPARAAVRLGHLALPDGLGRRRLLAGRGRGEGGQGGDRHRLRAAPSHRRHRRPADGVHPRAALLARVPLPRHGRRARTAPARDVGRRVVQPRTTCRSRSSASTGGARPRSRRSAASRSRCSSTRPAPRCGAATTDAAQPRRAAAAARRRSRRCPRLVSHSFADAVVVDETGRVGRDAERFGDRRGEGCGLHLVAFDRERLEPVPQLIERRRGLGRRWRARAPSPRTPRGCRDRSGRWYPATGCKSPLERGTTGAVVADPDLRAVDVGVDRFSEAIVERDRPARASLARRSTARGPWSSRPAQSPC